MGRTLLTSLVCAVGIYSSFLTWALVQEPLATKVWPNSQHKFQAPSVVATIQATVAMIVGLVYVKRNRRGYGSLGVLKEHCGSLAMISLSQSFSGPLATYSLQYVDYLTYMLAKSCKMMPVLLVHLLLYRTSIPREKCLVAVMVSLGVAVFTIGGSADKQQDSRDSSTLHGYVLLLVSLFLDGVTNASQDKMLKTNRTKGTDTKPITGAHMMFALNLFIMFWNIGYLVLLDRPQMRAARMMLSMDGVIWQYLLTYAMCGAIGQCFIFFTLEKYGSLILVMITVTRKMISMILSILVFDKQVMPFQWLGIAIVFGGISWEAICKRTQALERPKKE